MHRTIISAQKEHSLNCNGSTVEGVSSLTDCTEANCQTGAPSIRHLPPAICKYKITFAIYNCSGGRPVHIPLTPRWETIPHPYGAKNSTPQTHPYKPVWRLTPNRSYFRLNRRSSFQPLWTSSLRTPLSEKNYLCNEIFQSLCPGTFRFG